MAEFEVYSRRHGIVIPSDTYNYDKIPIDFRNQFINIITKVFSNFEYRTITKSSAFWKEVADEIKIEMGLLNYTRFNDGLSGLPHDVHCVMAYFLECDDRQAIDIIDLLIHYHYAYAVKHQEYQKDCSVVFDKINKKFKHNSLGYEIVTNQLVRIDNQFIHSEVVIRAINLLVEESFTSVSDEFLKAHEHYKDGDYKDAVVNAGKAFESTMKTICSKNGYNYDAQRDTANTLIRHLFDNELIPSYMQNHIQGLKQALENSAHVLRNKNGGHGQGDVIIEVDDSIVRYTLNLCATNIVFLVERYKETK
ncbi:STM4504/CBY_0614 family protein [Sporosarcina koreensis]|uniref:STM4504/CBY_0614 family protein n=1 Tax=Sporosarcina koreensis TaxID=334735 RepID=A0ABW0TZ82_9BACL